MPRFDLTVQMIFLYHSASFVQLLISSNLYRRISLQFNSHLVQYITQRPLK